MRVESDGGRVVGVRLDDDEVVSVEAVVVATQMTASLGPFAELGLETTEVAVGTFIEADEFGATSVPGVWAAGNSADLMAQVGGAAAHGVKAAQHLNGDLVMADLNRAIEALEGAGAERGGRR